MRAHDETWGSWGGPTAAGVGALLVAATMAWAAPAGTPGAVERSELRFTGGFAPRNAPYGGFGGGECRASRVPVVFLPGNGDDARNLDFPPVSGGLSVYATLREAGYQDCELFGLDYLSPEARKAPLFNFHDGEKATLVVDFVADVLAYTGQSQLDIIGHSLGATVALHAIDRASLWPKVRRFIAIAGAMRGIDSCLTVGAANPRMPVCGSQNVLDVDVFGLHPDVFLTPNPRLGLYGFWLAPLRAPATRFFTVSAGMHDGFICETTAFTPTCSQTARFYPASNVAAQLDVGRGSTALDLDFSLDDYSIFRAGAGDIDGVGHFRAKNVTGRVQLNMLTTDCAGQECCVGYADVCF